MVCPACRGGTLIGLASGALGCTACAEVFSPRGTESPVAPDAPEPEEAPPLDGIDAINAMLRRNQLVLGPGGVPLAETRTAAEPTPRRSRRRRRTAP